MAYKSKLHKTLGYWFRDQFLSFRKRLEVQLEAQFLFFRRGCGNSFLTIFCVWLYSISWCNFIVWLLLLLEILGNMCIAIVCFPSCDVIFLNLTFPIKLFFYMIKNSKQKFKSWERREIFRWNKKHFISF